MKRDFFKKRSGVTLVELLIALGLLGIIITLSASMINISTKSHKVSVDEYEIQSSMRIATEKTNKIIRYSSALFTIPKGRFFEANLTTGWNYLGVSEDGKEIISYTYETRKDGSGKDVLKHWKDILVPNYNDFLYEIVFERDKNVNGESIIKYSFTVNTSDGKTEKFQMNSEIEALNSLQVVDRGTAFTPAIALAYRSDERPQEQIVGVISMVLDSSGSMKYSLSKKETGVAEPDQRITKLKNSLKKMITEFSKEEYIEIALIPFSTTANYPKPTVAGTVASEPKHPFYKANDNKSQLLAIADGLDADGGTNTGDGMRRAYWRNKYFTENIKTLYGQDFTTREYMIILVDGVTTFASSKGGSGDSRYIVDDGNIKTITTYQNVSQFGNTGIIGLGNAEHTDTDRYVEIIGSSIKARNTKVYVIGFSSDANELLSVKKIANAAGALTTDVYEFTNNLDLDEVFAEIKSDIMKDLWHVRGPGI